MANYWLKLHLRKRGAKSALARKLKVTRATVCNWCYIEIPPERVPAIARETGISLRRLRPDLYPKT